MPEEIEKTTEEGVKKPYTLERLIKQWLVFLFLTLFVLPVITDLIGSSVGAHDESLFSGIATWVLIGMVIYTIHFLVKRKQFIEQKHVRDR